MFSFVFFWCRGVGLGDLRDFGSKRLRIRGLVFRV